jgi:hypothetical protein
MMKELCPTKSCSTLLFPDQHPNALGHQTVARIVLSELVDRDALRRAAAPARGPR